MERRNVYFSAIMFSRLGKLIKSFFNRLIGNAERRNPEAILELEQENLRGQIAKYNTGLASHAGLCEKLMQQVKALEREENDLRAKTAANIRAGNTEIAGQLALRFQAAKSQLATNRSQLEDAEKTYKELTSARDAAIKAARGKIESLKRDLSDLKMKNAMAELNEMASGMVMQIGTGGDTLDRLHDMVTEDLTKAAGRARVARDSIDTSELQAQAHEQKAMEDMALADFAAAEGISLGGQAQSAPAQTEQGQSNRVMGPDSNI